MKTHILSVSLMAVFAACGSRGNAESPSPEPVVPAPAVVQKTEEKKVPVLKADDINIVKDFEYDTYTLEDEYDYQKTTRRFQWDKIKELLALAANAQAEGGHDFGVIQNRRNIIGVAAAIPGAKTNEYKNMVDEYGVERYQGAALYAPGDTLTPVRYATDGCWLRIEGEEGSFLKVKHIYYDGEWLIPAKYVKNVGSPRFDRMVCVDRTNQNICTVERTDTAWVVRSMTVSTTGGHVPPLEKPTPLGLFVIQEKKEKMYYYVDGTTTIAGYAPWANRFSSGGYVHGVPVNNPSGAIIEYGWTLGTTPRSHMCVRTVSSHAKFIYDWAPVFESLVIVIE
jgi:lipoprotein-anchoring transpeptidase ErfK/SrfK